LDRDEAQDILDALRKIQDTSELQAAVIAAIVVPAAAHKFWH